MILIIYQNEVMREVLLPNINNSDYKIYIDKDLYLLNKSLYLNFESVNQEWYICDGRNYAITYNHEQQNKILLNNTEMFNIRTDKDELLKCIVVSNAFTFKAFDKYLIKHIKVIDIGRSSENLIQYEYNGMVSGSHCSIKSNDGLCFLYDYSANGVFINGSRVHNYQELKFGDIVDVFGLKILFFDDVIAIGSVISDYKVSSKLAKIDSLKCDNLKTFSNNKHQIRWFNRSPRFIPNLSTAPIVIEPPSNPQFSKKRSMLQTIGPSLTMAIPMLLGCGLAILSQAMTGGASSAFMFTGIITAVGSALIGTMWGYINIKTTRREEFAEESKRFNIYGNYLISITDEIKSIYLNNYNVLNNMYPSCGQCLKYDENSEQLWNRNINQSDFYFCRLGLGDMAFQSEIQIPKEKFTLEYDSLKDKPQMIYDNFKILKNIPVGIDFKNNNLYGIVGGEKKVGADEVLKVIITQIISNISYTDAKIVFCFNNTENNNFEKWNYMKILPHIWSENKKNRYFATNKQEASDVFFEISNVLRTRCENEDEYTKNGGYKPHYFLFVLDNSLIDGEIISKYIFNTNKSIGITTFIVTEYCRDLPSSCINIIQNDGEGCRFFNTVDQTNDIKKIKLDYVDDNLLINMARKLSNICVKEVEDDNSIVSSLDFFEMYGVSKLSEFNIIERWRKNKTYNSMRALIGKKQGGVNCYLDIHEKYHGPHGLVAGTTGSGKSELIQTLVLSLAINFSPEDMAFFIIDFKGGGMANLFSDLPHLAGQISNLSGNQIVRAMISIKSENLRRQKIFSEYGVNNINNYTRLYKSGESKIAIPHLIIIIDEFAELKKEEPDFMRELISVAQVGRSLGVHLILATQKPSGSVDDNIWSNTKFRLCLRVQGKQDSNDMLHKPDAAYITQAGRCYLQVGNDEIYELFQSGWSGAVYDENSDDNKAEIATMITSTGKTAVVGSHTKMRRKEIEKKKWISFLLNQYKTLSDYTENNPKIILSKSEVAEVLVRRAKQFGYNFGSSESDIQTMSNFVDLLPIKIENCDELSEKIINKFVAQNKKLPEPKEKTQLEAIVEYIKDIAKKNGYVNNMKLWLPLLSNMIPLNTLCNISDNYTTQWEKQNEWSLNAVIGLYDDPKNQLQLPYSIDFADGGHFAVCGSVVSGKSTFLQTLLYSFAVKYSPEFVNFYILDFSSGMLSIFENLPHTGGVIRDSQTEKTERFFNMITTVMQERKLAFSGGNYSQYVKVNGIKYPSLFIVIDNYANFKEKTENKYEDILIRISREGVGYGIYLIMSSAGFGMSEIQNRIADNIKTIVCLEMGDKYKYMDIMRTTHLEVMPAPGIKGRGICYVGDRILEFQTAVAVESKDDYERSSIIERNVMNLRNSWKGFVAKQIPSIPQNPTFEEIISENECKNALHDSQKIPFAYEKDNADIYSIDLSATYCYSITGKKRTGKTNVMKLLVMAASLKANDGEIVIIEKSSSELKQIANTIGAEYLIDEKSISDYFNKLVPEFVKRNKSKHQLLNEGKNESEICKLMQINKPVYIFIADMNIFLKSIYYPENNISAMNPFFENIFEKGFLHNIFFFACINTDESASLSGFRAYNIFTSYKTGVHLGGYLSAQRVFAFQNINFNDMSKSMKKGLGLVPSSEDESIAQTIVIPLFGEGNR